MSVDLISAATSVTRVRQVASAAFYQLQAAGQIVRNGPGAVMLMFGPFFFAMHTAAYNSFRQTTEFRWASQPRIGREPGRQFVGPGENSIELQGFVLPEWNGGPWQMAALRELGALGEPMILVDGRGFFWGRWCLVGVEDTGSLFRRNGAARRIDFRIQLAQFGEDSL